MVTPVHGTMVRGRWAIWCQPRGEQRPFQLGEAVGTYKQAMDDAELRFACLKHADGPIVGEFWVEPIQGVETST